MKAMILAAGFGTRLRPFSFQRPKPLFPVLDIPLLTRIISQLRSYGIGDILVNCYHLKEQITAFLHGRTDICIQEEQKILGTGGGMRQALDFFGQDPCLIVNGDIFHTIDLEKVIEEHRKSGHAASLIIHDFPRFNNVRVAEEGSIQGFRRYYKM